MASNVQQLQKREDVGDIIERLIAVGDLSKLTAAERSQYYAKVCESVGLNPFTRPFEYITLNGKLTLYARKDATDQLRRIHSVSVQIVSRERLEDVYVVTARATDKSGRTDESIGAVHIGKIGGDALCNALMKAETKAKRRVTLSICGLGILEESEVETIPTARPIVVTEGGEIVEETRAEPTPLQSEIIALWKQLEGMGDERFQGKQAKLAHLVETAQSRQWPIPNGLRDVSEANLTTYKSILIDCVAGQEDKIF